jgi:hypothetical protein
LTRVLNLVCLNERFGEGNSSEKNSIKIFRCDWIAFRMFEVLKVRRKEMYMRSFFAVSFAVFALLSNASAQGYIDIIPDEVKNPFYERHESITKELSKPQANEWVGTYSREPSPTWSEGFVWGPRSGFAAFRDTCSNGPRAWVNYGMASFHDGVLAITPERDSKAEYVLDYKSREFTPVKWGEQHWLVATDELALFAYTVNSRSQEEYALFYLKVDDAQKRRIGRPTLPPQYRRLLGLLPIKATVVEFVDKTEKWYPRMVIDAGKNKGVIEEMSFWLVGQRGINFQITVSEVGERTSVVRVTLAGRTGDFEKEITPAVGWRFTSRVP